MCRSFRARSGSGDFLRERISEVLSGPTDSSRVPPRSNSGSATPPTQLASTGLAADGSVCSVPDKAVLFLYITPAVNARKAELVADVGYEAQCAAGAGPIGPIFDPEIG
jgi:hypothetical protein